MNPNCQSAEKEKLFSSLLETLSTNPLLMTSNFKMLEVVYWIYFEGAVNVVDYRERYNINHPNTAREYLNRLKNKGLILISGKEAGKRGKELNLYSVAPVIKQFFIEEGM